VLPGVADLMPTLRKYGLEYFYDKFTKGGMFDPEFRAEILESLDELYAARKNDFKPRIIEIARLAGRYEVEVQDVVLAWPELVKEKTVRPIEPAFHSVSKWIVIFVEREWKVLGSPSEKRPLKEPRGCRRPRQHPA